MKYAWLESCNSALVITIITSIAKAIYYRPADDARFINDKCAAQCATKICIEDSICLRCSAMWPEICKYWELISLLLSENLLCKWRIT